MGEGGQYFLATLKTLGFARSFDKLPDPKMATV
jgi:hypothetical protein